MSVYAPVQLVLRNLLKSHWLIIFLNEALDGALTVLSGKEFQGVTTLKLQKCLLASVLQCNLISFRLCPLVTVLFIAYCRPLRLWDPATFPCNKGGVREKGTRG